MQTRRQNKLSSAENTEYSKHDGLVFSQDSMQYEAFCFVYEGIFEK